MLCQFVRDNLVVYGIQRHIHHGMCAFMCRIREKSG